MGCLIDSGSRPAQKEQGFEQRNVKSQFLETMNQGDTRLL